VESPRAKKDTNITHKVLNLNHFLGRRASKAFTVNLLSLDNKGIIPQPSLFVNTFLKKIKNIFTPHNDKLCIIYMLE